MNEKPLTPWVLSIEDGKIQEAHCDCMAGLGETCSQCFINTLGDSSWGGKERFFDCDSKKCLLCKCHLQSNHLLRR